MIQQNHIIPSKQYQVNQINQINAYKVLLFNNLDSNGCSRRHFNATKGPILQTHLINLIADLIIVGIMFAN